MFCIYYLWRLNPDSIWPFEAALSLSLEDATLDGSLNPIDKVLMTPLDYG